MTPELVFLDNSKSSIERARASKSSNRSFTEHIEYLGLAERDLGKLVLDIGSSVDEPVSKKMTEFGVKVVSINPKYGFSRELRRRVQDSRWQGRSVSALAQILPFVNESFDTVISFYCIPWHLYKEDMLQTYMEIKRVLKVGGKAYLAPVFTSTQINLVKENFKKEKDYEFEKLPQELVEADFFGELDEAFRLILKK